jgi:DNA segregation ATPase FtsK/SpoIIIE-like protein
MGNEPLDEAFPNVSRWKEEAAIAVASIHNEEWMEWAPEWLLCGEAVKARKEAEEREERETALDEKRVELRAQVMEAYNEAVSKLMDDLADGEISGEDLTKMMEVVEDAKEERLRGVEEVALKIVENARRVWDDPQEEKSEEREQGDEEKKTEGEEEAQSKADEEGEVSQRPVRTEKGKAREMRESAPATGIAVAGSSKLPVVSFFRFLFCFCDSDWIFAQCELCKKAQLSDCVVTRAPIGKVKCVRCRQQKKACKSGNEDMQSVVKRLGVEVPETSVVPSQGARSKEVGEEEEEIEEVVVESSATAAGEVSQVEGDASQVEALVQSRRRECLFCFCDVSDVL